MPDDRFLHPRAGQSRKLSLVSYRASWVWATYIMAADDFGVMLNAPHAIQAKDRRLRTESPAEIQADLTSLIEVGLVLPFTDQDAEFICDPLWQDFQKVVWPRKTVMPCPPLSVLHQCCLCTGKLFKKHKYSQKDFKVSNCTNPSCSLAKGLRQKANGLGLEAEADRRNSGDHRKAFAVYQELFLAKFGAKPNIEGGKDGVIIATVLKKYGFTQTDQMLRTFFGSRDPFIQKSGYTLGVFKSQINKLLVDLTKSSHPQMSRKTEELMQSSKEFLGS